MFGCDSRNSKPSGKEKLLALGYLPEVALKHFSCSYVRIFGFQNCPWSCSEKKKERKLLWLASVYRIRSFTSSSETVETCAIFLEKTIMRTILMSDKGFNMLDTKMLRKYF